LASEKQSLERNEGRGRLAQVLSENTNSFTLTTFNSFDSLINDERDKLSDRL
jgi:hypothetical protein